MFHTLSELKEKEKNKGKQEPKNSLSSMPKERSPEDNYYGNEIKPTIITTKSLQKV